ncbi:hypothetical protein OZ411_03565 [Bradyrhizobium sp. Arg237L]|uniref:hypothetical protein n=1 Tax=Bradyrhizobium sp. Arg237L TaxID=3003352 RepID=UPI00249EF04D|nr:hypothetical protein [Bradyrhizobium sp. Arg237L]MDI4231889.1 hypothetical protein [Bradyrhizobium sp. Arg237L]
MVQDGARLPLEQLATASPETLGLLMLKTDRYAIRLDGRTQLAAVSDALLDGAATARSLQQRFPGSGPREIARELQVPVVAADDDPLVASIWRFAEYRSRPPHIVLYTRGIAPLEQVLVDDLAKRFLGRATTRDVFIAHELYHHAEAIRSAVPIARRYCATLLKLGKWQWRTGIATLAEIAAGSFSQTLLDLPCYPKVLEHVTRLPRR